MAMWMQLISLIDSHLYNHSGTAHAASLINISMTTLPIAAWASYQIRKIAGCACAGNAGNVSPRRRFQRKPQVSDPGMHHGTCVTHVPWCMSGSLTCGDGESVPSIPGACALAILRIWQDAHRKCSNIQYYLYAVRLTSYRSEIAIQVFLSRCVPWILWCNWSFHKYQILWSAKKLPGIFAFFSNSWFDGNCVKRQFFL